ncbi:RABC [Hepatospora eriocheir]|uniref:RABC n=1 Tax=Hepatospora eriocheir TaxID=1081669 RepID=A0A1X0QGU9_9MICR|nr:RABC [Hepatospora eriocheir]
MRKSYKIILLGNTSVGKSSIIYKYVTDGVERLEPTIGIDSFTSNAKIQTKEGEKQVKLHIWDTAGQERYRALVTFYLRNSFLAIIVYSINDPKSFEDLKYWVESYRNINGSNNNIIIVANKRDLRSNTLGNQEYINDESGLEYAKSINATFCTTSVYEKDDIEKLFNVVKELINKDIEMNPKLEDGSNSMININASEKRSCC